MRPSAVERKPGALGQLIQGAKGSDIERASSTRLCRVFQSFISKRGGFAAVQRSIAKRGLAPGRRSLAAPMFSNNIRPAPGAPFSPVLFVRRLGEGVRPFSFAMRLDRQPTNPAWPRVEMLGGPESTPRQGRM